MNRPYRILLASALTVLVAWSFLHSGSSLASGGSTWKMYCSNGTRLTANVRFCYYKTATELACEVFSIFPGSAHTFNVPGAKCPGGFKGTVTPLQGGYGVPMRDTSARGNEKPQNEWWPYCGNPQMTVCLKTGDPVNPAPGDYGFCNLY